MKGMGWFRAARDHDGCRAGNSAAGRGPDADHARHDADHARDDADHADTTPTTSPDTTVPDDTTPDTTPTTPPTTEDPGINGDAPPESVPQSSETVPAATVPPGQPSAKVPPRARVVQIDAATARASALFRQAAYTGAVVRRQMLEAKLSDLQLQLSRLDGTTRTRSAT